MCLVATEAGRMPQDGYGVIHKRGEYLRVSSTGDVLNGLGQHLGREMFASADPLILGFRPFGRETSVAAGPGVVYVADGSMVGARVYGHDGRPLREALISRERRPLPRSRVAAHRASEIARVRADGAESVVR